MYNLYFVGRIVQPTVPCRPVRAPANLYLVDRPVPQPTDPSGDRATTVPCSPVRAPTDPSGDRATTVPCRPARAPAGPKAARAPSDPSDNRATNAKV